MIKVCSQCPDRAAVTTPALFCGKHARLYFADLLEVHRTRDRWEAVDLPEARIPVVPLPLVIVQPGLVQWASLMQEFISACKLVRRKPELMDDLQLILGALIAELTLKEP